MTRRVQVPIDEEKLVRLEDRARTERRSLGAQAGHLLANALDDGPPDDGSPVQAWTGPDGLLRLRANNAEGREVLALMERVFEAGERVDAEVPNVADVRALHDAQRVLNVALRKALGEVEP